MQSKCSFCLKYVNHKEIILLVNELNLLPNNNFKNFDYCFHCLKKIIIQKIEEYINIITPLKSKYKIESTKITKTKNLIENIDYYIENNKYIFTSWYHLKRGYCCKYICKNCPFNF